MIANITAHEVAAADAAMPDAVHGVAAMPDAAHGVVAATPDAARGVGGGIEADAGTVASAEPAPSDAEDDIVIEDGEGRRGVSEHRIETVSEARREARAPVASGELKVVVLPWAEVWLDGKRLGQAPILGLKVPAGRHTLRLENDAAKKTLTITVTPSWLTVIDVTL